MLPQSTAVAPDASRATGGQEADAPPGQHDPGGYAAEIRECAPESWANTVRCAAGLAPGPSRPYQVEIHLASEKAHGCPQNCIDCVGQFLRGPGATPPQTYHRLLDDLAAMGVPSVNYSGIYTDPLQDEKLAIALLKRGSRRWGVRLHTLGWGLTNPLRDAIIEAALAGPDDYSYVTFSKATTDPRTYARMCRPRFVSSEGALRQEEANLLAFFRLAAANGFPLGVTVNCRITQINGSPQLIAELLRWFNDTPSGVRLRFTIDYLPTRSPAEYVRQFQDRLYVDSTQARRAIAEAIELSGFSALERIALRSVEPDSRYDGPTCHNRRLFAAISASGKVHPCQGIASPAFDALAYGDLRHERFPVIWERMSGVNYWQQPDPIDMGCPHCAAACEKHINTTIAIEAAKLAQSLATRGAGTLV